MGNEASSPSSVPKVGFHVLRVMVGSPGAQAGLAPYFDFIVAANGHVLDKEDTRLVDILRSNLECQVDLAVYSTKTEQVRKVKLTPSLQWGGNGIVGVSTRFCSVASASENVWHILEVSPNSPAAEAGLESQLDYIVGTPDQVFSDSEDFYTLIQTNVGVTVQLYVYNLRDDNIRLVSLRPRKDWGGVGCLGCGVGYGLLHRIARDRKATLARYGISVEDSELGEQHNDFLISKPVPASTNIAPASTTAPVVHSAVPSHTEATTAHSGGQAPPSSSASSAPQHVMDQSAGEPIAHHSPQQVSSSPVNDHHQHHQAPVHESPSSPTQQPQFTAFVNDASPPAASASPYIPPSRPLYAPYAPSSSPSPSSSATTAAAMSPPTSGGAPLSGSRTQPLYSPAVRTPLAAHHGGSVDGSSSPYAAPAAGASASSFASASAMSGGPSSTGLPLPAFTPQQQPSTPQPYGSSSASSTGQYYYPGIGFTNQKRSNLPATAATTFSAPNTPSPSSSAVPAAPVATPPRSGGAPPLHGFYHPQQQPLYYSPTPTTTTTPQQQPQQPYTPSSH